MGRILGEEISADRTGTAGYTAGVNETVTDQVAGDRAATAAGPTAGRMAAEYPDESRRYDDIIKLPHHVSRVHPAMPVADRAAQFMPFAALTGHGEAIRETERLTDDRLDLENDVMESLDGKLRYLRDRIAGHPEISVTYFRPDARKTGGSYVTVTGRIKKIDLYGGILLLEDGTGIRMEEVIGMEGEIFSELDV